MAYNTKFAAVGSKFILLSPSNFETPAQLCIPIDALLEVYAEHSMKDSCQVKFRQLFSADEKEATAVTDDEAIEDGYSEEVVTATLSCPMNHVLSVLAQFK